MAHHKSAKKRIRANARKNARNRTYMSSVRTAVKSFRAAVEGGQEGSKVQELFRNAQSMLAKAAAKGMLHKNNVSRRVGRLTQMLHLLEKGEKVQPAIKKKSTAKKAPAAKAAAAKKATASASSKKKTASKKAATKKR